jgi:hypothetical protein
MLLSLLVVSAWASPNYPTELEALAEMPCAPTCTVCHETNSGGTGTVTAAFGVALMERGLTGLGAVDALTSAFDTLVTDAVDSDGDGTFDADELAAGEDPNPDGVAFCDTLTPTYGCFNAAQSPVSSLGVLGGLLAVAFGRRRAS